MDVPTRCVSQAYDYWHGQPGFCLPPASCSLGSMQHTTGMDTRCLQDKHRTNTQDDASGCGLPFQSLAQQMLIQIRQVPSPNLNGSTGAADCSKAVYPSGTDTQAGNRQHTRVCRARWNHSQLQTAHRMHLPRVSQRDRVVSTRDLDDTCEVRPLRVR